ncbi:MAG: 16S rRNA (cytidine(1402)-2'-O)-methyltransferase [Candidatus Dormibacteria bacterium]
MLAVVATPIGNLGDITLRALDTFREATAVIAEDTRRTRTLLSHYDIHVPLTSLPAFREEAQAEHILRKYSSEDRLVFCSDAGSPVISDPGAHLVAAALQLGHDVIPIPGPSAITAALSVAGIPLSGFTFLGFLPRRPGRATTLLETHLATGLPIVLYESPFRLLHLLELLSSHAKTRKVVVARELTKHFETVYRGTAEELHTVFLATPPKGECTIIIGGNTRDE